MRIAILGVGGVGGVYGAELARAGHEVMMWCRGANLVAIRQRGVEVQTPNGAFTVRPGATDTLEAMDGAELAIVSVKAYSLKEIAPVVKYLAERGALVLPLLNGVDSVETLVSLGVPKAQVLAGLTHISAQRVAPGVFERRSSFQQVTLGEPGGGPSPRAEKVAEVLRGAGIQAKAVEDIQRDVWRKFIFISVAAACCGLTRSTLGRVRDAPQGWPLLERAVREVSAVGRGRGVPLTAEDEDGVMKYLRELPASLKPSFLLDVEGGGPTELDSLIGAVTRLGASAGVPTPLFDTIWMALSVMLWKNKP